MQWVYDLGFLLFALFSLPHFLGRLPQAENPAELVRERLGFFSPEKTARFRGKTCLWIHAVSVGEALAAEKLISLLLERYPALHLVLTTVTPTGQRIAQRWAGDRVSLFYFPFDLRFAVSRFFEAVRPQALFLMETEIWPTVLREARRRGVSVSLLNGRLSTRSFQAFRRFSGIFKPLLEGVDLFLVQTREDGDRFKTLGVEGGKVRVTGNMKFDAFDSNGQAEDREALRRKWGFSVSDLVVIGGSTHEGEEEILLRVLRKLRAELPSFKVLLAPRHIERAAKISELVERTGFRGILASRREQQGSASSPDFDVLVLDQLGILRRLYAMGDVVFMGGSLVRHGGQNPIEPASASRAILHGPWVFNFKEIYERLDSEAAGLTVRNEEELVFALKRMLASERERSYLGSRACEILGRLRGATEENFKQIHQLLSRQGAV